MSTTTNLAWPSQATKGSPSAKSKAISRSFEIPRFKTGIRNYVRTVCNKVFYGCKWKLFRRNAFKITDEEKDEWTFGEIRKIEAEKFVELAKKHLGSAYGDCVIGEVHEDPYN